MITVKLADVYPLEDEYGNQYMSRDYSTKANQDYIRELAESMRMRGIPDEPISVVADGGIYRIKTGNSRVMAMRQLGTVECPAIIDDDDTVQGVIEAVVRTDVKKKYEALEKSRFTQQLFMFGEDDYVSEVTGIEPEKVKRMRRAAKKVDDAAEDMTLERLLIIDEFSDDPEAVEKLSTCREADVDNIADRLRRARKIEAKKKELREAFEALGVPVVEDRAEIGDLQWHGSVTEATEAEERLPEGWNESNVKVVIYEEWNGARATVYVDKSLCDDDDDSEIREQSAAYSAQLNAMDEDRIAWFWRNLAAGKPMPNIERECREHFEHEWNVEQAIKEMPEECLAVAKNKGLSVYDLAVGFDGVSTYGCNHFARPLAVGKLEDYRQGALSAYLDQLTLFQADGWDPGDAHALIEQLSALSGDEEGEKDE